MNKIDIKKSIDKLNNQSWDISSEKLEKSHNLAEEARELSNINNYPKGLANSLVNIAWYYLYTSKYTISKELFIKARDIHKKIEDDDGYLRSLTGLSASYILLGEYASCIEVNVESIVLSKKLNHLVSLGAILTNSTQVYIKLNNKKKALEVALESYEIGKKLNASKEVESIYLKNIADAYISLNDLKNGDKFLNRAYKIAQEINFNQAIMECHCSLGILFYKLGDFKKAESYFNRVYNSNLKNYNREEMILEIANFYFFNCNFILTEKYLKEALELAIKNSTKNVILSSYELYAKLSENRGDLKSMHNYLLKLREGRVIKTEDIKHQEQFVMELFANHANFEYTT